MTIAVAAMVAMVGREWAKITIGDRFDAVAALAIFGAGAVIVAGAGQPGLSIGLAGLSAIVERGCDSN